MKNININLCDTCNYVVPECEPKKVEFGDGFGNDNVIACSQYEVKEGTPVWVPRTGGGRTPGMVHVVHGDRVRVKFKIGQTFQGEAAPKDLQDRWGYKTLNLDEIEVIEEGEL